ncbi:MAG: hypothetical protein H6607_03445 [Flavobacteriales bacterium]|nr:hypothetical protein [Flavobacteriales bacterium]
MWKDYRFTDLFEKPPKIPCFLAGTMVHTEQGLKPIEDLKTGENVWSYNEKTKTTELQLILQTYTNTALQYIKITTTCGTELNVTGNHRFFEAFAKRWKAASQLSLGDYLFDAQNNKHIHIASIQKIEQQVPTHNIEVAQNHNYLVANSGILTHNQTAFSYADQTEYVFEFYTLKDKVSKADLYVGITTQRLDLRHVQHVEEGKRALDGIKEYNLWKRTTEISSISIKDVFISGIDGIKMKFFEARVIEQYLITYFGGAKEHKGLGILKNRSNAMTEYAFNRWKRNTNFNPCKYFV